MPSLAFIALDALLAAALVAAFIYAAFCQRRAERAENACEDLRKQVMRGSAVLIKERPIQHWAFAKHYLIVTTERGRIALSEKDFNDARSCCQNLFHQ